MKTHVALASLVAVAAFGAHSCFLSEQTLERSTSPDGAFSIEIVERGWVGIRSPFFDRHFRFRASRASDGTPIEGALYSADGFDSEHDIDDYYSGREWSSGSIFRLFNENRQHHGEHTMSITNTTGESIAYVTIRTDGSQFIVLEMAPGESASLVVRGPVTTSTWTKGEFADGKPIRPKVTSLSDTSVHIEVHR